MKTFTMHWTRRGVAGISLTVWSAALGLLLRASAGPLFWMAAALGTAGFLALLWRFLGTFSVYTVKEKDLSLSLGPWKRSFSLDDLTGLEENPARGTLTLVGHKENLSVSRRLNGYMALRSRLWARSPSVPPELPLKLSAAKSPLVFYSVMESLLLVFLATVTLSLSPGAGRTVLQGSIALLSLSLASRILFQMPLSYILDGEGIRVKYLLRQKYFPAAAAVDLVEDLYHADGAPFHLVKLVFQGRNLVLDEFNLKDPLEPLLPWIRANYGPAARSTF